MFRVKESVHVNAPIDRCFLLSTSLPLVQQILGLEAVRDKPGYLYEGLVGMGDRVFWRGRKFGLPVTHETLITGYDRPQFFQDTMVSGQFSHFHHDHRFEEVGGQTLMVDAVKFSLPFGWPGRAVGRQLLVPHVLHLLRRRFELLKRVAEGEDWRRYLPSEGAIPRAPE